MYWSSAAIFNGLGENNNNNRKPQTGGWPMRRHTCLNKSGSSGNRTPTAQSFHRFFETVMRWD